MKNILFLSICFLTTFSWSQNYTLEDFYTYDATLAQKTDSIFNTLNDTARIGQMIIPAAGRLGKSDEHITYLLKNKHVSIDDSWFPW